MPDADATISVNLLPAHLVTYKAILNGEQAPDSCGRVGYYTETLIPRINYFVENEEVVLEVHQQPGFRLVDVTVVNDETGEPIEFSTYKDPTGLPGINASYFYNFIMPDEPVTVTAYFERFTPLSFIEQDRTESLNPPVSEDHVVVSDELIGVWAVKNLLWAKDQSPYKAYDSSEDPGDTYDYVRQNMKLQKHEWDQSNWVILDFSQLSGWQGNESDYIRVEEFVDHKIKAGSISGIYYCEGNLVKAQHEIVLDAWPVLANPDDRNSLGYPGYLEDPKEELTTYDYHYNHYVPSNFLKENIGGRYGEAGTYGAVPGNPSPVYRDVRLFFMNPKDDEVAQVWAVWYGSMEFYDEYSNQDITADVFETFVPDYNNGVNVFGLEGAFYVPSWEYNRKSSDRNDYGKPTGDNTLEKNTDYLFHIAIQRHGESDYPGPVSKAGQGTQATSTKPWTYYMVYPLDLEPDKSISTSVKEVNPPATTTIDSIRYYNMMGQESQTPFDGINIMVIRYKDGSFISKKILR